MDLTNILKSKEKITYFLWLNNVIPISSFQLLPVGASVKAESAPSQESLINMLEDISFCHLPRHIGLVCK